LPIQTSKQSFPVTPTRPSATGCPLIHAVQKSPAGQTLQLSDWGPRPPATRARDPVLTSVYPHISTFFEDRAQPAPETCPRSVAELPLCRGRSDSHHNRVATPCRKKPKKSDQAR
jgi:hypothetical protein